MLNINRKSYSLIVTVIILMPSCRQQSLPNSLEAINIINKDRPIELDIYDIVDSISYIPLETSEKCLLGELQRTKRDGDFYFVEDTKGLFVFGKDGRFLNEIGHKGNAPGEYLYMDNFYLDRKNKQVCIINNVQKRILRYAYDGTYISMSYLGDKDANIESAMLCDGGELLAFYPLPNDLFHVDSEYRVFREKGDTLVSERIMDAKALTTKDAFYPFLYFPMVTFNNKYFLASVFSNELYQYENGKTFPVYHVDTSATIPDEAFLDEHKDLDFFELLKIMNQRNIGTGITALEASSDYLFALIDNRKTLVWDGEKGILISTTYNSDLNLYSSLLTGGSSDEHVGYLSAEFFCEKKEDSAGSKALSELADSLSEDDNPVLFQYHFKKDAVKSLMEKYKL